jgi:hypothetical protein
MKIMLHVAFVAVASAVLLCAAEAPLHAQVQKAADIAASMSRGSGEPWSRLARRQPQVDEALRGFGFRMDRLDRRQERSLDETFQELFPGRDPQFDRLNRTQANALVYMALVHGSARRDEGRLMPRRMVCESAASRVHELETLFAAPGRGQSQMLRRDEQERLSSETREISRLARLCGDDALVDHVDAFASLLDERRVERDRTARHVTRMKTLARAAVGR